MFSHVRIRQELRSYILTVVHIGLSTVSRNSTTRLRMVFPFRSKPQYLTLDNADFDEESKLGQSSPRYVRLSGGSLVGRCAAGAVRLSCISAATVCAFLLGAFKPASDTRVPTVCIQPAVYQEWRTLSDPEKDDYIQAVKCLSSKPSKLISNDTMYDDFPRVHKLTAPAAHKSAPFLPWHHY